MDMSLLSSFDFRSPPPSIVVALWLVKCCLIFLCGHRIRLRAAARRERLSNEKPVVASPALKSLPKVCVQLPVYNEPTHIEAAIEHLAHLDWPRDRLQIQILDDSTESTPALASRAISAARERDPHLDIVHLRRSDRLGYKAGALNRGMSLSSLDTEFYAIFDCDFRPSRDFLKRAMTRFTDEQTACVQVSWAYTNPEENALTRIQKMMLNTHFHIDHAGRHASHLLLNFNGTAGIWRRKALTALGGWSDHTVTEDLYLSFQAYTQGWKVHFADDLACLSELPADLPSFLVQQRRWCKGNAQVCRLLSRRLLSCRKLNLTQKWDSILHLAGYAITTLILTLLALGPLWIEERANWVALTSAGDPWRLLDLLLWVSFWLAIMGVYSSREAHYIPSSSPGQPGPLLDRAGDLHWTCPGLYSRLHNAFFFVLASPLLSLLLFRSYWEGLLVSAEGTHLIFHRTPKNRSARGLGRLDHALCLLAVSWFLLLALISMEASFYTGTVVFIGQSLVMSRLWLGFGGFRNAQTHVKQWEQSAI